MTTWLVFFFIPQVVLFCNQNTIPAEICNKACIFTHMHLLPHISCIISLLGNSLTLMTSHLFFLHPVCFLLCVFLSLLFWKKCHHPGLTQLFVDSPDKLVRFSTREDGEDRVYIQDLKRAVSYVRSDDKSCRIQNLMGSKDDKSSSGGLSFSKSLAGILFMDGEGFYYLGKVRKETTLTTTTSTSLVT